MSTAETYHTDLEAAARYRVSRQTLWAWCRKGLFPQPVKIGPNCTRWRESDLAKFEAERAAASQQAAK